MSEYLWIQVYGGDDERLDDPHAGISLYGDAAGCLVKLPPEIAGTEEKVVHDTQATCPCCNTSRRCLILSTVTVTICPRPEGAEFYWRKIDE